MSLSVPLLIYINLATDYLIIISVASLLIPGSQSLNAEDNITGLKL